MAQACINVPFEHVFKVGSGETDSTLSAEVYETTSTGDTKIADITAYQVLIGYYLSYTFTSPGIFTIKVIGSTGTEYLDAVSVVDGTHYHNSLDSYINKDDFKADVSALVDLEDFSNFAASNHLHLDKQDKSFQPPTQSSGNLTGDYIIPTNGYNSQAWSWDPNDHRFACKASFVVGLERDYGGDGMGVPSLGTLHEAQVKFYIWRDTGSNDASRFGEVIWSSDTVNVTDGSFHSRSSLIGNSISPTFPYGQYNYNERYLHEFELDNIELSGNYLFGYQVVSGHTLSVHVQNTGLGTAWYTEYLQLSNQHQVQTGFIKYYRQYHRIETFTTDDNSIERIQDRLDETLDANVVSVTGTSVANVDAFKASTTDVESKLDDTETTLEAIKLRVDNMPQG